MTKLVGTIRPAKDGLSYDISGGEAVLVFPLATKIQKKFGFEAGQFPAIGIDTVLVELVKNDVKIIIGWDIWSDLFVMSEDGKGNELVKEIASYLEGILDELYLLQEKLMNENEDEKNLRFLF